MSKLLPLLLSATIGAAPISARAEGPTFDYALRAGHSTNLFEDTNALKGNFAEAQLKLRGTVDLEGSDFSYAISHHEKRLQEYHFGDFHGTGLEFGYKTKALDKIDLSLEAAISRNDNGDVFIAVPGTVIGYRAVDYSGRIAATASTKFLGGENSLTGELNRILRGNAKFTTSLLQSTKVEADVTSTRVTASHIRPALSGEIGATVEYRTSYIPTGERDVLERYPASVLRGSFAYGRKIGEGLTLIADLGATAIMASELGDAVRSVRPYMHLGAEWKLNEKLQLGIGYDRDFAIADIDDPLGELVDTFKAAASLRLTPIVETRIGYEIASSEWMYYIYKTKTQRLTGTLAFEIGKGNKLEFEYSHVRREETDPAESFRGHVYAARFSGSF